MKRSYYAGIDVLRGLGIFIVLILHTAFYSFEGIFELDLSNPPVIITIIGLLLMFAGLFAMISGFSHGVQILKRLDEKMAMKSIMAHLMTVALFLIVLGAFQKTLVGSGQIDFDTNSFDNTVLVELIRSGNFKLPGLNRILYINSLTMMGLNVLLLGLVFKALHSLKHRTRISAILYFLGVSYFFISLLRLPLYDVFMNALDDGNYPVVLLLDLFVNKNNPILPYFSFALFGAWMASLSYFKVERRKGYILVNGFAFLLIGGYLYMNLPDTMLERAIDLKWFSIMGAQIGLFMLMMLIVLDWKEAKHGIKKFLARFGVAGLSVYLAESSINSILIIFIKKLIPGFYFSLYTSLFYGIITAVAYGFLLMLWERHNYKYGVEYLYIHLFKKIKSAKESKMGLDHENH